MAYVAFTEDQFNALDDFLTELAQGGGQATLVPKTVTENGTYDPSDDDADGYSEVTVAVPIPVSTVEPLSVTQNGTYTPPTGVDGYAPVTVNVSGGGGTSAEPKDVNFIDYDGTIRYSYTKDEFLALTAMPENPTHEGLVSQGWNWTLADAQEYVAECGMLVVGQMYATESGATEIDIVLHDGHVTPTLGLGVSGEVSIDWGDGTEPSSLTGTSTTWAVNVQHSYAKAGKYTIKVQPVSGTHGMVGDNNYASKLLWFNDDKWVGAYRNSIKAIRLSESCTSLAQGALRKCAGLGSITLPSTTTSMASNAFYGCRQLRAIVLPANFRTIPNYFAADSYSLEYVSVPKSADFGNSNTFRNTSIRMLAVQSSNSTSLSSSACIDCANLERLAIQEGITSIGGSVFENCGSLASVTIPSTVTQVYASAFSYCGLSEIHFRSATPPTARSGTFTSIPTDCTIYVPAGSLAAYTSASNYPDSTTYTYVEE